MRPYIICHMMASLDGRIDCEMTEQIDDTNHYYEALAQLGCPSTLEGKTTLAMHYAQDGVFQQRLPHENAGQQLYKAVEAIGRMTDNSILLQVVSRSLEKPEGNLHSGEMSS